MRDLSRECARKALEQQRGLLAAQRSDSARPRGEGGARSFRGRGLRKSGLKTKLCDFSSVQHHFKYV